MENKIAISSLAANLSQTTGKSKKLCEDFLKEYFRVISECLEKGESLKIKGFGTFKVTEVEARTGVNVTTGEKQEIAAYKKVVFTPAKELATEINAPFVDFETVEMDDELPEELVISAADENEISNENKVEEERLVEGSEEEADDDEITLEAYNIVEKETRAENPIEEPLHGETYQNPESPEDLTIPENHSSDSAQTESPELSERDITEEPTMVESQNVVSQYVENQSVRNVKSRFGIGFLLGSISTFAVCVVIFTLGCFFGWWPVNFGNPKDGEMVDQHTVSVITPEESISEETDVPEESPIVYDTVSKTRYLTTIAREHYGNYNFWPYIYKENESILGHPDRITPGTEVVVPDLSKYGVDPSNKDDVAKAKKMGAEIYSRYK